MELSYLPGAASLIDQLDKRISIILRDGRNLVGMLRSFDQYMNLTIEHTFERVIVGDKYTDIPLGIYIVRGDNVVLLGEIDEEKSKSILTEVTAEELANVAEEDIPEEKKALVWDFE